ncbi:MAG: hypothetical protein NWQ23_16485 [Yoonia sp.]|uniref:hypothetical protein n=1 Tax=Yoonia sp. TaxID=2212373 RepID=UPI00273E0031|nr:hypothetical protein [Yoonia sp.]MDP5087019.1 hypothetical protein [Yoonia sp.]MDP5362467.1 hypothetical protein [Paracoccaceae bacterium]
MTRLISLILFLLPAQLWAQEAEPHMTLPRMAEIVLALDPEAQIAGAGFTLTIDDIPVLIVTDPRANRMRAMVPIRSAETMTPDEMQRVMQANFDSALDARYAVAQGRLWGIFIHPLKELERDQLISGIAQTVNVAKTYGTLYTSGAGQFGAGDSGDLQRALIEELLERGQDI